MLALSLLGGPVPTVVLLVGLLALVGLAAQSGRRWWTRVVPLAVLIGVLGAGSLAVTVDQLWRPFPDPLPLVAVGWAGAVVTALALAVARRRVPQGSRTRRRQLRDLAPFGAVVLVTVTGLAQVNQHYQAYPTLRSALGLPFAHQIDLGQLPTAAQQVISAAAGEPLTAVWRPPPGLPAAGAVSQVSVPGTTSGFAARPAWIYLPPAYLSEPRALLPVLVLVPGQPGSPRDWLDGGRLIQTMDAFAAAHQGLAPVVLVADPLGGALAQTLCVDSPRGRAFTYLTVDVPAWIRGALQVDVDPAHWAVGGLSSGGTCALQLAANPPDVYPTFLDLAGQDAPDAGSRARTVTDFFGGSDAAFKRVNPLDVLATGRLRGAGIAGMVVAGADDTRYRPDAQRVHAALLAAGVDSRYLELPGGHSWQVWGEGLRQGLPFLAVRAGLTPR